MQVFRSVRCSRQRLAVAAVGLLGLTGTLALTGAADASPGSGAAAHESRECGNESLDGRYIYHYEGHEVREKHHVPVAGAGIEEYDGEGGIKAISASSDNGEIGDQAKTTGTYEVYEDCTGTATYHDPEGDSHYRLYVDPEKKQFTFLSTDDKTVIAGTESRVGD